MTSRLLGPAIFGLHPCGISEIGGEEGDTWLGKGQDTLADLPGRSFATWWRLQDLRHPHVVL